MGLLFRGMGRGATGFLLEKRGGFVLGKTPNRISGDKGSIDLGERERERIPFVKGEGLSEPYAFGRRCRENPRAAGACYQ